MKKDIIATWTAVVVLGLGWALTIAGFIVSPLGIVDDSVLWILGQALIYAGSVFGISIYTHNKLTEMSRKLGISDDLDENKKEFR